MYVCAMAAGQPQPSGTPVPCSSPPASVTWTISSHLGDPVPVVDVRGCGALRERVVTGIGEVMAVGISPAAMRKGF